MLARGLCIPHYSRKRIHGEAGEADRRRGRNGEMTRQDRDRARRFAQLGVTPERYAAMVEQQQGRCAICGRTSAYSDGRRWCIDHDHRCCAGYRSCGRCVRGLLCTSCNHAIGLLGDDVETIRRAAAYLEKHPAP